MNDFFIYFNSLVKAANLEIKLNELTNNLMIKKEIIRCLKREPALQLLEFLE